MKRYIALPALIAAILALNGCAIYGPPFPYYSGAYYPGAYYGPVGVGFGYYGGRGWGHGGGGHGWGHGRHW